MKLKSFGCSFIYGSDLADCNNNISSLKTWPSLLAQQKNLKYTCYAWPGAGNLQILEQLLNQLNEPALYVIGWSWIDRFDYNNQVDNSWKTIMPIDTGPLAKIYYKDLHSQYRDKFTNLVYIKTAIDTLKQKGYPFIMTHMDNLLFETKWHTTPAVVDLQNYIRPYITQFNGNTFLDWANKKGFPISETLHPLEDAHQAAFELIKSCNLV
jgi:hypothetical protein